VVSVKIDPQVILPLYHLNEYQIGCFVYRCVNALLPKHICSDYFLRACNELFVTIFVTVIESFSYGIEYCHSNF